MDAILEFMNSGLQWFETGLYEWTDSFLQRSSAWVLVFYLKIKLAGLEVSYSVAQFFLDSINMTAIVQTSINQLPATVVSTLSFFKIPQAINTIVSAYTTRFVMDLF